MSCRCTALLAAVLALTLIGAPRSAPAAELEVVTSLPYLSELVRAVGGEAVSVRALISAGVDPSAVKADPRWSAALRRAALFVETGVSKELWVERALAACGEARVQRGASGHLFAASGLMVLADESDDRRALVRLDPVNLKAMARTIEKRLAGLAPASAEAFSENRKTFEDRLNAALYGRALVRILGSRRRDKLLQAGRLYAFLASRSYQKKRLETYAGGWARRAMALRGTKVLDGDARARYFALAFGLEVVDQAEGAQLVLCPAFYSKERCAKLAKDSGARVLRLPTQAGELGADSLFAVFELALERLGEAVKGKR